MIPPLELKRNIVHILCGTIFLFLIHSETISLAFFTVSMLVVVILFLINLRRPIPIAKFFVAKLERKSQKYPGAGALLFLFGIYLAFVLYPKDIALAAIAIVTFGDSIAPLVGHMGKIRHPLSKDAKKLLEGSIAGMIVAFLVAMLFVKPLEAFVATLITMTLETVEIKLHPRMDRIDDNIIIPLVAGITILAMRALR